jgi:hypothetical protein
MGLWVWAERRAFGTQPRQELSVGSRNGPRIDRRTDVTQSSFIKLLGIVSRVCVSVTKSVCAKSLRGFS